MDDTADNVRLLSKMLAEKGYKVFKALSGKMALTACATSRPDLILLDVMMPEMDGYEVCRRLKADEGTGKIPVIFLSALNDVGDKVKAFEVGGVDYITKPFQRAEVLSRVEIHLQLCGLQIDLEEKNSSLEEEIREREKAQKALEISEAKNKSILQAIPDIMFRIDAGGSFLDYRLPEENELKSPCFPQGEDCAGKNISEVLSGDFASWLQHYILETLEGGKIQIAEYMQQVDGKCRAYEVRFVKSGESEVLAIARDISSRKQAEAERLQAEALVRSQKEELEKALGELQAAQVQLVQNEKMAALGQLVAGIAHEINNPVSFIYSNLACAGQYIEDLLSLIELYQQEYPEPKAIVRETIDEIELDFLVEDLPDILEAMHRGADRIRAIVMSLRNFSRLDEAELKAVDIHEGIDSTLVMLQHRLSGGETGEAIEVIKKYGDLPLVNCYARQLNQVFINLLNNAIDALSGSYKEKKETELPSNMPEDFIPTIIITTEKAGPDTISIRIANNGPGISESVRSRLFDPFFTTKPVGKGVGLSLSICYQIVVQKHGGKIACSSELAGRGTEFAIALPVRQVERS